MKILIVLFFVSINSSACDLRLLSQRQKSENETVVMSPTPPSDGCVKENYKHKSEAELAALTLAQLMDEEVKEQIYHKAATWSDEHHDKDYGSLIGKYIDKYEVKILLPVLTEYMNTYDPKSASECEETRFFVAYATAGGLDGGVVRLRGTQEGRSAIDALGRAIERMREADFDKGEYKRKHAIDFALLHLEGLKGINGRDEKIRNTLRARHKVEITDGELLEFSNYLISLDPTYPTWSDIAEGGPPFLVKESKKYYEAFLKFREKK